MLVLGVARFDGSQLIRTQSAVITFTDWSTSSLKPTLFPLQELWAQELYLQQKVLALRLVLFQGLGLIRAELAPLSSTHWSNTNLKDSTACAK